MRPEFEDHWLSAYLDDELSPEERAHVELCLANDLDARELLDDLKRVRGLVANLSPWTGPTLQLSEILKASRDGDSGADGQEEYVIEEADGESDSKNDGEAGIQGIVAPDANEIARQRVLLPSELYARSNGSFYRSRIWISFMAGCACVAALLLAAPTILQMAPSVNSVAMTRDVAPAAPVTPGANVASRELDRLQEGALPEAASNVNSSGLPGTSQAANAPLAGMGGAGSPTDSGNVDSRDLSIQSEPAVGAPLLPSVAAESLARQGNDLKETRLRPDRPGSLGKQMPDPAPAPTSASAGSAAPTNAAPPNAVLGSAAPQGAAAEGAPPPGAAPAILTPPALASSAPAPAGAPSPDKSRGRDASPSATLNDPTAGEALESVDRKPMPPSKAAEKFFAGGIQSPPTAGEPNRGTPGAKVPDPPKAGKSLANYQAKFLCAHTSAWTRDEVVRIMDEALNGESESSDSMWFHRLPKERAFAVATLPAGKTARAWYNGYPEKQKLVPVPFPTSDARFWQELPAQAPSTTGADSVRLGRAPAPLVTASIVLFVSHEDSHKILSSVGAGSPKGIVSEATKQNPALQEALWFRYESSGANKSNENEKVVVILNEFPGTP